jgi:hypothetical protein
VRLVLDTNVTISGLLWRGTPYRLLQAIRSQQPQQQIYTSRALLEELTEVITRPTFAGRLGCSSAERVQLQAAALRLERDPMNASGGISSGDAEEIGPLAALPNEPAYLYVLMISAGVARVARHAGNRAAHSTDVPISPTLAK